MSVAEVLDRECVPLPKSVLLDVLFELAEREEPVLDGAHDDEDLIRRTDEIYAWAEAHNVRIRI